MPNVGQWRSSRLEVLLKPARGMPPYEHLRDLYGLLFPGKLLQRLVVRKGVPLGCCFKPSAVNFAIASERFALGRSSIRGRVNAKLRLHQSIYCSGLRGPRRQQTWPKTRSGRNQPIRIYRWLLAAVDGPGRKGRKCATHICGNAECLNLTHLQWQSRQANVEDYQSHKEANAIGGDGNDERFSRLDWPLRNRRSR